MIVVIMMRTVAQISIRNHASGVDFDNLFDQVLPWAQPGDALGLLTEMINAIKALKKEIDSTLLVFKNGCVDLVQQLAGRVKDALRNSEVNLHRLSEGDGNI